MTSTNRYHISKDGKPRKCDAKPGACKVNPGGNHYVTPQAAMEAKITDLLTTEGNDAYSIQLRTLAQLNLSDQEPDFLMQCALSEDHLIRSKVTSYAAPLPREAYGVLATSGFGDQRADLAYSRDDLPDDIKLLLASDKDPEVREAVMEAEGMWNEEDLEDIQRADGHSFADYKWAMEARISHPSPVVRQAILRSYTPNSGDGVVPFGPEGEMVVDYYDSCQEMSADRRDKFLAIYNSINRDADARVRYANDLADVAQVALSHNRVREFQNARGVAGDVGAVLSVRDLLPAGVGDEVLRPAREANILR